MALFSKFRNKIELKESSILYSQTTNPQKNINKIEPFGISKNNKSVDNEVLKASEKSIEHKINKNFKLNDGTVVSITPEYAEKIMYVNEELNFENQIIFQKLLTSNIQSYEIALQFCNNYN